MAFLTDDFYNFSVLLQVTSITYTFSLKDRCSQEFLELSKRLLTAVSRFDATYVCLEYLSLVCFPRRAHLPTTCSILRSIALLALFPLQHGHQEDWRAHVQVEQSKCFSQTFIFCALLVAGLRSIQGPSCVPDQPFASSRVSVSSCLIANIILIGVYWVSKHGDWPAALLFQT